MIGRMRKTKLGKIAMAAIVICGLGSCGDSGALGPPKLPSGKSSPEIFENYNANGNSKLAGGWTRTMDMSGVSFDNTRTATLITPRHVVMAKHYSRNPAEKVIFHDREGKRIERTLIGISPAAGDVTVGLLNEPLPENYHRYSLPATNSNIRKLIGKPVVVSDQKRSLFVHLINRIGGGSIAFRHDEKETYGWEKNLVVGDSGNPTFLIAGKELILIETHTTGGPGAGPYYGNPTIQSAIRSAVAKLDSSYSIRTVRVP